MQVEGLQTSPLDPEEEAAGGQATLNPKFVAQSHRFVCLYIALLVMRHSQKNPRKGKPKTFMGYTTSGYTHSGSFRYAWYIQLLMLVMISYC